MSIWSNVWAVTQYAMDRTTESLAAGFDMFGNLASFAAGISNAVAFATDEMLLAGYSISANATGVVNVNMTAPSYDYHLLESFPFSQDEHSSGSFSYELSDYLQPFQLQMAALVLISTGVTLKVTGSMLRLFIQSLHERSYFQRKKQIVVPMPDWKEYGLNMTKAFASALAIGSATNAVVLAILKYSDLLSHTYQFTYPEQSSMYHQTANFTVPLEEDTIPIEYEKQEKFNVSIGPLKVPVDAIATVIGSVLAKYGAGVFISNRGVNDTMIGPAAATSAVSYAAQSFFSDKAEKAHKNRLIKAGQTMPVDEESPLVIQR